MSSYKEFDTYHCVLFKVFYWLYYLQWLRLNIDPINVNKFKIFKWWKRIYHEKNYLIKHKVQNDKKT